MKRYTNETKEEKLKNKVLISVIAAGLVILIGYFTLGIFVIQPMGAIPDGATIIYFRTGINLPFISSADGILLEKSGSVNLLGRATMMATLSKPIIERKAFTLPYSRTFYLISTGGTEFEK